MLFHFFFYFLLLNGGISDSASPPEINLCPDLTISNLTIVEEKRKCIIVEFTISNEGSSDVSLLGTHKSPIDNIAIQAYFSGDRILNKGDVLGDGTYIKSDQNVLHASESYSSQIKISKKAKSNHVGVLILKVDATHLSDECDETNNTDFLIMEW